MASPLYRKLTKLLKQHGCELVTKGKGDHVLVAYYVNGIIAEANAALEPAPPSAALKRE